MAREIRVAITCDRHAAKGEDVEARALPPIKIGAQAPRELDLCAECEAEIYQPLYELLHEHGRIAEGHADTPTCPHCDRTFRSRGGLRRHITRLHGDDAAAPAGDAREESGAYACLTCGQRFQSQNGLNAHRQKHRKRSEPEQPKLSEFVCPECGKADFAKPSDQAVRMHRIRAHGYRKDEEGPDRSQR